MIVFKVTFDCEPGKFKADELHEALKDFVIMKVKTEGIKLGKVVVEEEQGNVHQSAK